MKNTNFTARAIPAALLLFCALSILPSCSKSYRNGKLVSQTLDSYWFDWKPISSSPRDMILDLYGNGSNSRLRTGKGEKNFVETAGYFSSTAGARGWAVLRDDIPQLPRFVARAGKDIVEPAPNMFVSVLASVGYDREAWIITATGEGPAFKKYFESATYFLDPAAYRPSDPHIPGRDGNELGWTLAAIADYGLDETPWVTKSSWENRVELSKAGQRLEQTSILDFLFISLRRPLDWGPTSGLDENFGVAEALKQHRLAIAKDKSQKNKGEYTDPYNIKVVGRWLEASDRIQRVLDLAVKNQNADGSFSSTWSRSKTIEPDKARRARHTARIIDIAAAYMNTDDLQKSKSINKAVKALCQLMLDSKTEIKKDPYAVAYGLHALRSFNTRMPGHEIPPQELCDGRFCMQQPPEKGKEKPKQNNR